MLLILYLRGHCDSQVKSRYRCKDIIHHNLQILICDPLKTKWTVPLLYLYVWENPSVRKRLSVVDFVLKRPL